MTQTLGESEADKHSEEDAGELRVARILLDSALPQLDHLFDYAVPERLATQVRVGQRVKVPFRSRRKDSLGYIIELAAESEFSGELAEISSLVSPVQMLTPEVWRLARRIADRAGGSAGDVLRLAIPQRLVRVEQQHQPAVNAPRPPAARPAEEQEETAGWLLAGARLTSIASHGPVRLETGSWVGGWAEDFAKTATSVFNARKSVIIVVPDYRDLDQATQALAALGHEGFIRVDSRQTNAERYAGFLRCLDPVPRIIVGNRSAIYAPAHDLGAILMWDDGDPVLAEPRSPYVHARDAALVRAEQEAAGLLLAAHSRSAEVQRLVNIGYVKPVQKPVLRSRFIHSGALTRTEEAQGRMPEFVSRVLRGGLTQGPVLVQVSTPGYAPLAVCRRCLDIARCAECHGPIGYDTVRAWACRWCGTPGTHWSCKTCNGTELDMRGAGSERTMEQLERMFPGTRVIVSDGNQPRTFVDARPSVVVATRGAEPLAAGGYRAIAFLDVERLLGLETLRAGEDCLRWWQNAAALAHPDATCVIAGGGGPVVQALVTGRLEEWLQGELEDRRVLRYPPMVRVASVTGGIEEVNRAVESIEDLDDVDVLGPTQQLEGRVKAIVRFPYSSGDEVAKRLRAVLVADAAGNLRPVRNEARDGSPRKARAHPHALRLRFDDRGVFDSGGESI